MSSSLEAAISVATPLRLLLGGLIVCLWIRIDVLAGYLRRVGTEQEQPQDRRCTAAVLLLLGSIGFLLRIEDLGGPGFSWDEAMYAWVGASRTLPDLWHSVATRSPHPVGYFVLLHAIMGWSWEPFWLRLPSVLAGSALIWASYAFVRRMAGAPAGLMMATFVTFAPMLVELSRVARNYAIAFLLIVAAATYFVRYLQQARRRDLVAFALTSLVGLLIHFCFLIVLAAQYAHLALEGIVGRRRPAWWLQAALCQVPVLVLIGVQYQFHIRQLDPTVQATHEWLYSSYMHLSGLDWLAPILKVWTYLAPLGLALPCMAAYISGLALLLVRGMHTAFLVCVLPVLSAYAASWTGQYPMHESRHSAYLFPFLLAPTAVAGAELASGGQGLRRLWGSAGTTEAASLSVAVSSCRERVGIVSVALALACFIDGSIADYRAPVSTPGAGTGRVTEFLKNYRGENIDRAFAILESHAKPNDIVLLTEQGAYEFRRHYRLRPVPERWAGENPEKNLLVGAIPKVMASIETAGVRYYYTPRVGRLFKWLDVNTVMDAFEEIRDAYRMKPGGSLWVFRGGWDPSFADAFRRQLPGTPTDAGITAETNDVLFHIDGGILARTLAYRQLIRMQSGAKKPDAAPPLP